MNLFELRELGTVEVFPDTRELFNRLSQLTHEFDTSTDAHSECDLRLVEKLEAVVVPLLGEQGIDDERWFHEMDYYGDGVRLIEAEWNTLTPQLIRMLRALLCGEHEKFCVLWKVYENFGAEEKGERGAAVVFADRILVTDSVLTQKTHHA